MTVSPMVYQWNGEEQWRTIPSLAAYSISDRGRVRRDAPIIAGGGSRRAGGHILKVRPLPTGHLQVTLSIGNQRIYRLVHRLVAEAFLPPAKAGCDFVCHRNDQPADNCPTNLYWGDRADNAADAMANGRVATGERVHGSKLTPDIVREVRRRAASGESQHSLAGEFGVHQSNISQVVSRVTWRHVA